MAAPKDTLDARFDRMTAKVSADVVDAVTRNCAACKQTICRHDKTLYGNGRAGLTSRVSTLWYGFWILSVILSGVLIELVGSILR